MKYQVAFNRKLIYVMRINYKTHEGCLKIGEATINSDNYFSLTPNSRELNNAAKNRINQYTQTAGVPYDLLYTEVSTFIDAGHFKWFNDKEIHHILERSGVKKKTFNIEKKADEWFVTDLETVKKAITAFKEGRQTLHVSEITKKQTPIKFRPEQKEAIKKTIKQFKKTNEMLWFAKMRFGKTLSALQVVKEHQFKRTLILTHRPVVDKGWFEDFNKIFYDSHQYNYGSKKENGSDFENLEKQSIKADSKYIFFASMQDLRGSSIVGGNFDKNDEIFSTDWDFIIIDEAHEGTQTVLGINVLNELQKTNTKVLQLSGTPFNIVDKYKEEEIFTWDYVMEQRAKADWDKSHFGDPNPYAGLPKMNIYTYNLGKLLENYKDEDVAFNFREFFRVNEHGKFLHEKDVQSFLNLICKQDDNSNYPYSTEDYRDNFRHSLWMVPGVKEARALEKLLNDHHIFKSFGIANVAGEGNEEEKYKEALKLVESKIGDDPDETYTITLSCGRLTTGVSVKPWTAVFMLAGSYNTSASIYMQTIFRVQTPATINGRVKEECFVFDFAPDRTLKVIAETAKMSAKAGTTTDQGRKNMRDFLNFCPVIGIDGSKMHEYDVGTMLEQLKKVYVERVVSNGFEDNTLYNQNQLMKLGGIEIEEFNGLKKIIGATKAMPKTKDIDVNKQGLNKEEYEQIEEAKKKKELSKEEKELLDKEKEYKKLRDTAISILRGISIRMPLLIYGANVPNEQEELSIDNFTTLIDNHSWAEFMPKGVTKETFIKFKKYYDPDIFKAAGKKIRAMARATDKLSIEERIARISAIFSNFRNPDKETVLTPWRVVNMHLGDCLGGYVFIDDKRENTTEKPNFIDNGTVTKSVFATDSSVLEINSKSGLYPLYVAYNIFRNRVTDAHPNVLPNELTVEEQQILWDATLAHNIFVICKTPMAKSITRRTLLGFREGEVNLRHFDDILHQISDRPQKFIAKIKKGKTFWKSNNNNDMKFNAIVGNPPYNENDGSGASDDAANPIYQNFVDISKLIKPEFISLIMPSKWMFGGKAILKPFRKKMMVDKRLRKFFDFEDSGEIFIGQNIDGGICYFLWDIDYDNLLSYNYKPSKEESYNVNRDLSDEGSEIIVRDYRRLSIINKVKNDKSFKEIVSLTRPFGIRKDLFNKPERYPNSNLSIEPFENCIKIHGVKGIKGGAKRNVGYINKDTATKNTEYIDKYKLFFTTSFSANAIHPPKAIISDPGSICTETFLVIGPFPNQTEQLNCLKYMQTNFFKILLFYGRGTMQVSQKVFSFIPIQNFKKNSEIDWNNSIENINEILYKKYELRQEEIELVEKMINPKV